MIVYKMPAHVDALVFDMDMTLYRNEVYYKEQSVLLWERLALELGKNEKYLREEIEQLQPDFEKIHGKGGLSLARAFEFFHVDIKDNAKWRAELFNPEQYLERDPQLVAVAEEWSKQYKLCVVSNNAEAIVQRTLQILGIADFFSVIVGLDRGHSKPGFDLFEIALQELAVPATSAVSIGDRYAVDIAVPMDRGMGAILVESMDDVYNLSEALNAEDNEEAAKGSK